MIVASVSPSPITHHDIGNAPPHYCTRKQSLRLVKLRRCHIHQPHIRLGSHSPGNFVCAGVLAMWMSLPVSVNACSPLIVA